MHDIFLDLKIYFHHSSIKAPTNLVSAGSYLYWSEFKSSALFWMHKSGPLIENQFDLHDLGELTFSYWKMILHTSIN